jgi:hypothetical protein
MDIRLELVVFHTAPFMFVKFLVNTWRQCGGLMRNILYRFIESQSNFSMLRGAEMSLVLNEPK